MQVQFHVGKNEFFLNQVPNDSRHFISLNLYHVTATDFLKDFDFKKPLQLLITPTPFNLADSFECSLLPAGEGTQGKSGGGTTATHTLKLTCVYTGNTNWAPAVWASDTTSAQTQELGGGGGAEADIY